MSRPGGSPGLSTLAVHAGDERDSTHALEAGLVLASAFDLGTADEAAAAFRFENDRHVYGRWGNPTVAALERKLAALEGAEAAVAAASGMGAVAGVLLAFLRAGDHVVAPLALYGETARLLRERLPAFGVETTFVDATADGAYLEALRPTTRVLYVETPANPTLGLTDVRAIAALGRERGMIVVADNTFATPHCQRPLELGAHLVLHSLTKSLGGHGDALGGVVAGDAGRIATVREQVVKSFGAVLAPFNAFLVARGLRTFALRQRQACASALEIARFLEGHAAVERVHYPGLASHPQHGLAQQQMRAFGSLVAFELRGGREAGRRLVESVRCISHAVSLGDVRSLITHPASTTASTLPAEIRRRAGIADGLLRLSVGIEDTPDLIDDLAQALSA
ncbi:MAG: aminotransferase class I/II-fold pyridoxal phosphate-dependent enzyme [Polyangiaceae bacterium]|nr:aminotransferase class I/II-fold pyridoxal phosphate-dependent enzyme [Polyangiaceae bacterium]